MLALAARRLKLSYNVLNLRNLHCRPTEQCQSLNDNNDESNNSKSVASKRFRGRCEWDIRGRNPGNNFSGLDQYKKVVSHSVSDQRWWKSRSYDNQADQLIAAASSGRNSQAPYQNNHENNETIRDGADLYIKSSKPFNNQCIIKQYAKQKKRRQCDFLNYQWCILKWTTGVIGSFYASKLMCLYARRRRNSREWKRMEQALAERQKIQKEVLDKHYATSKYQKSHVPIDKHAFDWSEIAESFSYQTIPVTNDHEHKQKQVTIGTQTNDTFQPTVKEPAQQRLDTAVDHLRSVLAHWEFELGVDSMKMDRPEVAISHFKAAAVHGHLEATYNLGVCYEKGIGTGRNLKMAMESYRTAANMGDPRSLYNLGVFIAQGKGGLKKNRKAAKDCFEKASLAGSVEAKAALRIPLLRPKDANPNLTDKSHQITSELNPVHRALSAVV